MILYIFNFIFVDSKLEDNIFYTERQQAFPDFSVLLIVFRIQFSFLGGILSKTYNVNEVIKSTNNFANCRMRFWLLSARVLKHFEHNT